MTSLSFFDKEVASDTMDVLYRRGVDPKVCRLWAKLNETRIQVRTGVGNTEKAEIGTVIGQGTIGGAIASQGSLDDGIRDQFQGSQEEIQHGSVEMGPLIFQDDLLETSPGVIEARAANIRVATVMHQKRLTLNEDKSVCLVWGTDKQKQKIKEELEERPLMCGQVLIKMVKFDKWLGDYLHNEGLAESVLETVKQREGKVKGAALEIADIVEDWRARTVGGFVSGLFLWESCCIPSLLYNAGSWQGISKDAEKRLDALQNWFLRILLRQGPGAPSSAILWELQVLTMARRIWREKLCLCLHVARLDEDTLANKIWKEQQLYNWPGLAKECKEIAEQLGVENVNDTNLSASLYRKTVTEACHSYDADMLKEDMKDKVKCAKILSDGYGRKEYVAKSLPGEVREFFSTRVSMLPLAGNFSRDNRFRRTGWLCLCGEREEQEHVRLHCNKYKDIREKYDDLTSDDNLVNFYREVLLRRDKVREQEEKEEKRRRKEQGAGEKEEE